MQMTSLAFGIALLTSVSVGPALAGAQAAPVKARTTVESRTTWPAGSVEAASTLAWVKARSPGYAPVTSGGDISIVRRQIEPQPLTRTSRLNCALLYGPGMLRDLRRILAPHRRSMAHMHQNRPPQR